MAEVIVLEGINDIGQAPHASATRVIAGLREILHRLRAARLRVLRGTLTPDHGFNASYGGPAANATRQAVNEWIRRHSGAPVVDFDRALRDPHDPSRLAPRFDSGDHLHPGAVGYRRMARAVDLRLLRPPRCPYP